MNEERPRIRVIKDVGYRVISKSPDGSPKKVWKCLIKEGQYGKFISVEQHWVRRMEGKKIVESDWAKKSINFPYDKEKAFATWTSIRELIEDALGVAAGTGAEQEEEEGLGFESEEFEEIFEDS